MGYLGALPSTEEWGYC